MARRPCAGRKIFLWQESPEPGERFICGKRVPSRAGDFFCGKKPLRRAGDFFVARRPCAGREIFFVVRKPCTWRKIFLWQESPEPGAGFDKTYNFFNFFFSVSPFSLLSLPFPFLRSPFFLFFRSPLFSCVFLHFVLSAYEKLLCRNKSASLVTV